MRDIKELHCTLQPAAAHAFRALRAAAALAGIGMAAASSFRDFDRQVAIWNDKFLGRRALLDRDGSSLDPALMTDGEIVRAILHWSALPGASRHHWGSELDLYDPDALGVSRQPQLLPAEYASGGVFARLDRWLSEHAEGFGFFRPYDRDRGGVQPEPWHLSFAPIAAAALPALTVEVLAQALHGVELAGMRQVRARLPEIHARYVNAVAMPSELALAAPQLQSRQLSPATRPS